QDLYLAPFFDADSNGVYEPTLGDYPDYGFELSVEDCLNKQREDPVPLFGDNNIYWIFNDKGNTHTETGGQPIGLEVRAQAFSFNSNDEINNMTFYNYVVINQGTQTLLDTYFGHFVDPDRSEERRVGNECESIISLYSEQVCRRSNCSGE